MLANIGKLLIITGLTMVLGSCGGGSTGPKTATDGRIFLDNRVQSTVKVTYLNQDTGLEETVLVEPGQSKEITQSLIKGGTEVTLHVTLIQWDSPSDDIKFRIDGNVTVHITWAPSPDVPGGSAHIGYSLSYD